MKKHTLGSKLSWCRELAGITRAELADAVGVCIPTIWRWENDKVSISLQSLKRLAAAMEISIDDLVGGTDDI